MEKVIQRARNNDEKAIRELYDLTVRKAYFIAKKYIKDDDRVQDVLQESYIKAFQSLDLLKDNHFDRWFYTIVTRKCLDALKKKKETLFSDMGDETYQQEEFIEEERMEFQPKENTDYNQLKSTLGNILDEIPAEQRMCILMYYYQGFSVKEIAEVLETSQNTIKSRLNYARKAIKESVLKLEKHGYKIRGIAPIPFIVWMLQQEEAITVVPSIPLSLGAGMTGASSSIASKTLLTTLKGKVLVGVVASTVVVGGGTAYYSYTHTIDLSEGLTYEFEGADNYGKVVLSNNQKEAQSLINTYQIENNRHLSNGDKIKVSIIYDKKKADKHHYRMKGETVILEVKGLSKRYINKEDVELKVLDRIYEIGLNKVAQEKGKNKQNYKICRRGEKLNAKDNKKREYYDIAASYLLKGKKGQDRFAILLRRIEYEAIADSEWGINQTLFYADYYYVFIDNAYKGKLNTTDDVKKNMSGLTLLHENTTKTETIDINRFEGILKGMNVEIIPLEQEGRFI